MTATFTDLTRIVRPTTAMVMCTNQLMARIVQGEFKAGEKLPPERSLALELGVDRGTLRSALQRLITMGLIRQQPKNGTIVLGLANAGISVLPVFLRQASPRELVKHIEELLEVRRHLATIVFQRLAAMEFTPRDLEPLERALVALAGVVGEDGRIDADLYTHAELEVLRLIVLLSESKVLPFVVNPIFAVEVLVPQLRLALAAQAPSFLVFYRGIMQWLAAAPDERISPKVFIGMLGTSDLEVLRALQAHAHAAVA